MKKYVFRNYNKNFPKLFESEKKFLARIIPFYIRIEHIGSTSVPGLGGKGIIDILLVVDKRRISLAKFILAKYGFSHMGDFLHKSRISFFKTYGILFFKRRVHIHLTYPRSKTIKETLKFKNLLLTNPLLARRYAQIKKVGVKLAKGDGKIYRKHKKKFIERFSSS